MSGIDYIHGYRIVAPKWEKTALSGEGARKYGGRWNSPGRNMVYLGGSRALSALELLVHLTTPLSRAKRFSLIEILVPRSEITTYPTQCLPDRWNQSSNLKLTAELGDDWYDVGGQLAMVVPSVLIPEETNIVLNPEHRAFKDVVIGESKAFYFDKRL